MSVDPSHRSRRGLLLGLVAVLVTALAVTLAAAEPAGGQASLECDGGLYITTGTPDDMTLTRVDQRTGDLTPIGPGGLVANGVGHNPADDFLYGIHVTEHRIVRVAADGTETDLGVAVGTPPGWVRAYVGTFLPNGRYLVLGDNAPASTPRGTVPGTWAEIDVTASPPEVVRTFSHPSIGNNDIQDVALNPVDGGLYAASIGRQRIVRIDPTTGAASEIGPTFASPRNAGSAFFDSFGRLWLYGSATQAGRQDTLFRIDDPTTDRPVAVSTGPTVTNSDGASCPFSLGMDKTVTPTSACAGTTVRYRFELTNRTVARFEQSSPSAPREAGETVRADFVDQLPADGRTFVAGSLQNPFGGTVNEYGGTARLRIDGLQIPPNATAAITVDVALPADLPAGTVTNQARLVALSGNYGSEVLSEYPGTPELPDPTPLLVRSCADLGIEKSTPVTLAGPGDEVTYTLRVTNHGPSAVTDVDSVADALPPGLTFRSASHGGAVHTDGTVRWPGFALDRGRHLDLTVTAVADDDVRTVGGDAVENVATVSHPDDPEPANDRATATVPLDAPDLVVVKDDGRRVVAPGEELTYTITVTNTGDGDAHGVVVTDTLPPELAYVGGSDGITYTEPERVGWPAFDLPAGEARRLTVVARVRPDVEPGTVVRNVAVAPHPDDRNPDDNEDDDRNEVDRVPPPGPDRPDDPTLPWLPRTGTGALATATLGVALLAAGLLARRLGRRSVSRP